ncbi:penicillin-binding protein 2 [Candidatus Berkelbacteria bacterium]|nr:penicillin-binding protein 2 [Candidatus Berkelbacteria bacterium]
MRRHTYRAHDQFQLRLTMLVIGVVFGLSLLTIRLFVRSVVAHELSLEKAEQQYLVRKQIAPHRGKIYARDGARTTTETVSLPETIMQPFATNERTYALAVVPRNIKDTAAMVEALAPWLPDSSPDDLFAQMDNDKLYLPPFRHGLSEEEKNQLAALHLPGLLFIEEEDRYYPEGSLASHLLGFVNAEGTGNYGVEQTYDAELRGSGGEVLAERDVRGRILTTRDQLPVRDGETLILTIDRTVQAFVEQTLTKALATYEATSGSIVLMDVQTGDLIALANQPDFDPNTFGSLASDEQFRFLNPSISAVWEPGSIFKTIVMAAALDHGLVEPDTEEVFSNVVIVGGEDIHTAEDKAFGRETMTQVLENSDNVGMVWVADQLGNERFGTALEAFGLGKPTGIDLPGEISGYLRPWDRWRDINRATMAFGQGVSVTPLQLTTALAALANGGQLLQPHIVAEIVAADGTVVARHTPKIINDHVISPETSLKITGMMVSVVENGHGKRAKVPGYKIAGKTGTAQVPNPDGGYYDDRHIGGFGGFFPADQPRFAMVVKLDDPKTVRFAESSAAPTFGEIARFVLNYYRIPPTEPVE